MRPASAQSSNQHAAGIFVMLLFPLMSAIGFAIGGGIISSILGKSLKPLLGFEPVWWQGALAGFSIGLPVGSFRARAMIKRFAQVEEASLSLGLQPLAQRDVNQLKQRLHRILNRRIGLDQCFFRSGGGADIVVGELTIRSSSSSNSSSPDRVQTCVYLKADSVSFPEFSLQPEGFLLNLLAPGSDIDFDDSPDFSKRYFLTAPSESDARKLFTRKVRSHFEEHPGLQVCALKNEIVIYQPKRCCKPDEIETFVNTSLGCLSALRESSMTFEPEKTSAADARQDGLQQAANMSGLVGSILRRQIETTTIGSGDLRKFLNQPVPRDVPAQLKKKFRSDPFLNFISLVFCVSGIGAVIAGCLLEMPEIPTRAIPIGLGLLVLTIFGSVIYLSHASSNKKMRALIHGDVISGTIVDVSETGVIINNQPVYEVKFQPQSDGSSITRTKLRGANVRRMQDLFESGETTTLLQDPANPKNSLLIECFGV